MTVRIITGDCREVLGTLPERSADCCVTSPPYWGQRHYSSDDEIGREDHPDDYVAALVGIFDDVRRVLKPDGALWLNLGEKWASVGHGDGGKAMASRRDVAWARVRDKRGRRRAPAGWKDKDMIGLPWLVAMALQADGWFLRQAVVWDKMVATEPPRRDRPSQSHEYLFLLAPSLDYAVRDPAEPWFGTSIWRVRPQPREVDHPALMPPEIARRCIVSSSPRGGMLIDPFGGGGTTGLVADRLGRDATLIELSATYADMARRRIADDAGLFKDVA